MAITAKDLKPAESEIVINKKIYVLRLFDLASEVWAYTKFATKEEPNGLLRLATLLQSQRDFGPLIETGYHLLDDKSDFPTKDDFIKALEKDGRWKKIEELSAALSRSFGVSQIPPEEIEDTLDIKKHKAAV